MQSAKNDAGKPRLSLVPFSIIWDIAKVREYGCQVYEDPENWRSVEVERYWDALLRHVTQIPRNDLLAKDKESGLPHLWHAACNVSFILELLENG